MSGVHDGKFKEIKRNIDITTGNYINIYINKKQHKIKNEGIGALAAQSKFESMKYENKKIKNNT